MVDVKGPDIPPIEIVLPEELPLDMSAVEQLVNFASVKSLGGQGALRVCATPDFHKGSIVPVICGRHAIQHGNSKSCWYGH